MKRQTPEYLFSLQTRLTPDGIRTILARVTRNAEDVLTYPYHHLRFLYEGEISGKGFKIRRATEISFGHLFMTGTFKTEAGGTVIDVWFNQENHLENRLWIASGLSFPFIMTFIIGMFKGWWESVAGGVVIVCLALLPFVIVYGLYISFRIRLPRDRALLDRILVPENFYGNDWIRRELKKRHRRRLSRWWYRRLRRRMRIWYRDPWWIE